LQAVSVQLIAEIVPCPRTMSARDDPQLNDAAADEERDFLCALLRGPRAERTPAACTAVLDLMRSHQS